MRESTTPGKPFGRRLYFAEGEIDRICSDALEPVGCLPSTPAPIEIDLFIEKHFGCALAYEDLEPAVLGFAVFGSGGTVELVGAARSLFNDGPVGERRVRATLAHEAGHGLLHAKLFSEAPEPHPLLDGSFDYERRRIMCRKEDLTTGPGYDGKWWEWQAYSAPGFSGHPFSTVQPYGGQERGGARMSEKPTESGSEGLPKRWSAGRKAEVVVRLLRGEDLGEVSREIRVTPPELERWRRLFLEGAQEGLKGRSAPDGALMRTRAKLGEMTMRVELQAELLEKRGFGDELRKLLRRSGG